MDRAGGQDVTASEGSDAPVTLGTAPENFREQPRYAPTVARVYATDEIEIIWEPSFCIHAAECIRNSPGVFDSSRRPWVEAANDTADNIATAVHRCPTGALHFRRLDGGEQEAVPDETTVYTVTNGPLFVRGKIRIVDDDGSVIREDTRVALCRCGASANKPFCDNSHSRIRFKSKTAKR